MYNGQEPQGSAVGRSPTVIVGRKDVRVNPRKGVPQGVVTWPSGHYIVIQSDRVYSPGSPAEWGKPMANASISVADGREGRRGNGQCEKTIYVHLYVDVDQMVRSGCGQQDLDALVSAVQQGCNSYWTGIICPCKDDEEGAGCIFDVRPVWHSSDGLHGGIAPLIVTMDCGKPDPRRPFAETTPGAQMKTHSPHGVFGMPVVYAHEIGHNLIGTNEAPDGFDEFGHNKNDPQVDPPPLMGPAPNLPNSKVSPKEACAVVEQLGICIGCCKRRRRSGRIMRDQADRAGETGPVGMWPGQL